MIRILLVLTILVVSAAIIPSTASANRRDKWMCGDFLEPSSPIPSDLQYRLVELFDSSVLEESLSIEEYPDLDVYQAGAEFRVSIGASLYSTDDGDNIGYVTDRESPSIMPLNKRTLRIDPSHGGETFFLIFSKYNDGTGKMVTEVELLHQLAGQNATSPIAVFTDAPVTTETPAN